MGKYFLLLLLFISILLNGCTDHYALAQVTLGKNTKKPKATGASVISMGRDDDDGKAKKWHIGGRLEEKLE